MGVAYDMSNTLRSKVIRLAHQNPALRPHLLPLLRSAAAVVDLKKAVAKLAKAAQKDLQDFAKSLSLPLTVQVGFESPVPRGGYGPFEIGNVSVGGMSIRITADLAKATVGVGAFSGPHLLESFSKSGTVKEAPANLKPILAFIKEDLQRAATKNKVTPDTTNPLESVKGRLKSIRLGPAGRVRSVEQDGTTWFIEPENRQRLDHYGNDGDGWDEDGWEEDYADPVREAAEKWLNGEYGPGIFNVDVGEKGHVDVSLTPAGKKKFGL